MEPPELEAPTADRARCRNCGAALFGRYCADCSQPADVHVPSTHEIVHEVLEGLTHSDSRLWRSLKCLWFYPGKLTQEFIAGKRASYLPPFRLYLVLSVIFFLLASLSHPHMKVVRLGDAADPANAPDAAESMCADVNFSVMKNHGAWSERIRHACGVVVRDHGASLVDVALSALPKAMFIFLPFVALLHMLMYWRPRHRYAEHLIFFLHLHAFFFSVAILLLLSGEASDAWPGFKSADDVFSTLLFWLLLVYTLLAIRRVFREGWPRTGFKFAALLIVYAMVLNLTVIGVFAYAALKI